MSEHIVSPSLEELHTLRTPLNEGERIVLDFFLANLPKTWEIYIQPHLNGLRPDFVLLNPKVGIAVFEVKDWNLDAMHYYVPDRNNPELWANKQGKSFRLADNPVHKAYLYRDHIKNLYAPEVGSQCNQGNPNAIALITSGIIFTRASTEKIRSLLSPFFGEDWKDNKNVIKYMTLSGIDLLIEKKIETIFPSVRLNGSYYMNEDVAKQIRGWLIEPDFAKEQRQPLELNSKQQVLATTRTVSGFRRIRGIVGSGKSLTLAARAAHLSSENKNILIATFNITLWHYLRDLIVRYPTLGVKINNNITFTHFHEWCKSIIYKFGMKNEYTNLLKSLNYEEESDIFETEIVSLANRALDRRDKDFFPDKSNLEEYDAILIDEGQDYNIDWWNTLRRVLKNGGEMVLAADEAQDLYSRAKNWTEQSMKGAGFSGPWSQLDICYRCPDILIKYLRKFAEINLPNVKFKQINYEPESLNLYPVNLIWIQVSSDNLVPYWCANSFLDIPDIMSPSVVAFPDLTIILPTHRLGLNVVELLNNDGFDLLHIFDDSFQEKKSRKMNFFMGDAHAKACTIHSFKGWEARYMIVGITKKTDLSCVYVAMSRLKRHIGGSCLIVVCSQTILSEYGQSWPCFQLANQRPDKYSSNNPPVDYSSFLDLA